MKPPLHWLLPRPFAFASAFTLLHFCTFALVHSNTCTLVLVLLLLLSLLAPLLNAVRWPGTSLSLAKSLAKRPAMLQCTSHANACMTFHSGADDWEDEWGDEWEGDFAVITHYLRDALFMGCEEVWGWCDGKMLACLHVAMVGYSHSTNAARSWRLLASIAFCNCTGSW